MAEEEGDDLQLCYTRVIKIEQKLETHLQNLQKLSTTLQNGSGREKDEGESGNATQQYRRKLDKFIRNFYSELQSIEQQLEQQMIANGNAETRYEILQQSHQRLLQSVAGLKQQLHKNKQTINKCRKLQDVANSLLGDLKSQRVGLNKLQQAYNNALRLQNDMQLKIQQLQGKQNEVTAKLEWQTQREVQGQNYWKDSEVYDKLAIQKNEIYKKIEEHVDQGNKQYMKKFAHLSAMKNRLKDIDSIYGDIDISVGEQELIIKEIMINEGIASKHLLQVMKKEGKEDEFGENDEEDSHQMLKNLSKFRRAIGIPSATIARNTKIYTQPVPMTQSLKITDKKGLPNDQIMRLTAKIPQNLIRERSKRHSLPYQRNINNTSQNKKTSGRKIPNRGVFLPKVQSKQHYQIIPVSHSEPYTPARNMSTGSTNLKKKMSNNVSIKHSDTSDNEGIGKLALENHFIRMRTKGGGFLYKNIETVGQHTSREHSSRHGEKSEIVSLYEKLSSQFQDCLCEKEQQKQQAYLKKETEVQEDQDELQKTSQASTYVKLSKTRRKGKQSNKKMIESRESDTDNEIQDKKLKAGKGNLQKVENRRRLNTIHQKQQQPVINSAENEPKK